MCPPRQSNGRQDGRTGLRSLHQHPRLRNGMPETHYGEPHRPPQPGIPQGEVQRLVEKSRELLIIPANVDKDRFHPDLSVVFQQPVFQLAHRTGFSTKRHPFHPDRETGVRFLLKSFLITLAKRFFNNINRLRNTRKKVF